MRKYVVVCVHTFADGKPLVSYWYGPQHGFGTTAGSIKDAQVRAFSSRAAAENALKSVYGTMAYAKRRGYAVVPDPRVT